MAGEGLKDREKKGQGLAEDEGAWCQWALKTWSLSTPSLLFLQVLVSAFSQIHSHLGFQPR